MHLFIIDLFISLDTVAPLIDGLNRNKQKTKICFANPLQDFSNHKLVQYLNKSKFNENHGTLCLGIYNKFFFSYLKTFPKFLFNYLKKIK